MNRIFTSVVALVLVGLLAFPGEAADSELRLFDRQLARVSTGTAYIDTSAAVYTGWVTLITVAPDDAHALEDVKVVVDLDLETTGFAEASGYDTETLQLAIARKVDGTNWRTVHNLITPGTAIAADDSDNLCLELSAGLVGPGEGLRIMVKLSAEAAADVALPYVVYYRSGASAVVTPATN